MHATQNSSDSRPRYPRWVAGLLILQSATLMVALGALPGAAPVEANQPPAIQGQENRDSVLPNAAAQRQEQIRLLKQIADEMSDMNAGLKKLNDNLAKAPE